MIRNILSQGNGRLIEDYKSRNRKAYLLRIAALLKPRKLTSGEWDRMPSRFPWRTRTHPPFDYRRTKESFKHCWWIIFIEDFNTVIGLYFRICTLSYFSIRTIPHHLLPRAQPWHHKQSDFSAGPSAHTANPEWAKKITTNIWAKSMHRLCEIWWYNTALSAGRWWASLPPLKRAGGTKEDFSQDPQHIRDEKDDEQDYGS